MKFLCLFLFMLILVNGCKIKNNSSLIGKYQTQKSTETEKWVNYITNKCTVLGVSLDLKKDSTYIINTCSYEAIGFWKISNNTLLLHEKLRVKNTDSLSIINEKKEAIDIYLIKKKYLFQNFKTDNQNCSLKLEKIE